MVMVGAGLDARGSGNIFRYNHIENNIGAGVRLGGHKIDDYTYGVDNEVYGNIMKNNKYAAIKAVVSKAHLRKGSCRASGARYQLLPFGNRSPISSKCHPHRRCHA